MTPEERADKILETLEKEGIEPMTYEGADFMREIIAAEIREAYTQGVTDCHKNLVAIQAEAYEDAASVARDCPYCDCEAQIRARKAEVCK